MTAQQPGQQSDKSRRESQKRNQLHRIRWIIVIIVLILIAAGTVIWLLTLQGTWITILPLDIFTKLTQPDITAFVLTGIGGVGKSTLAALVYRYAEEQRQAGEGLFASEAVWLNIDPAVTFADLAGNLFEVLGKPLPDFTNLSLQHQAMALFNVLNTTDQQQLVILDQFENLLDLHTGHALADRPGVAEWIDAINSQQCTCRILLTSRL